MKKQANHGRYFYMCYANAAEHGKTCQYFEWLDVEKKYKEWCEKEQGKANMKG
jgi:hypothetical protein